MTNPAPDEPGKSNALTPPTITATAGYMIAGAGFLPDHQVTVRVTYTAENISDYLTFITDPGGHFHGELPTSAASGVLHITATDHRADTDGACGLLWSNTQTVRARGAQSG